MEILTSDHDGNAQVVRDFLRDLCPDNLKPRILELLAEQNWPALEREMELYYNQ